MIQINMCIFAAANVDRFVMIATTVKNAKAIFYSTFILKSVTLEQLIINLKM